MKSITIIGFIFIIAIFLSGCVADTIDSDRTDKNDYNQTTPDNNTNLIKESDKNISAFKNFTEKDTYKCNKICEKNEFCNAPEICEKVELKTPNICGNYVCDGNEKYSGKVLNMDNINKECFYDCEAQFLSEYHSDVVEVDCGCSEYSALADRHSCIEDASPCSDCSKIEPLFPELVKTQTEIFNCLVDYFKFKPNKLTYKVFYNPALTCEQKEGCSGIEGGAGGADYVMFHNLNGYRDYGESNPTKPEQLTADVHETAHYFLYQMVHGVPSWFHEVIAINTNEYLVCNDKQSKWGDSYIPEGDHDGINMDDGTNLNIEFYKRYKEGKSSLTIEEKQDHYITAVLFIFGLQEDYNCGFYCIRDIVLKLHEYELKACLSDSTKCSIQEFALGSYFYGYQGGSEEEANKLIKKAVDEITGKDSSTLFNFLEIGKYEPSPSPCGPTSTCSIDENKEDSIFS